MLLETTTKYCLNSEDEANTFIEQIRANAKEKGFIIKKAEYQYKTKKSKGEIIAEAWVVSITEVFSELWGDL